MPLYRVIRFLGLPLMALFVGISGQTASASEWMSAQELWQLYSRANATSVGRRSGNPLYFSFRADGSYEFKVGESSGVRKFPWWIEQPNLICRNARRRANGKFCWKHRKNDPSFAIFTAKNGKKLNRPWKLEIRSSEPAKVSKYFDAPSREEVAQNFGDNLDRFATSTPIQEAVRGSLSNFKQAYLAANSARLRDLVSEKFRSVEKAGGKILSIRTKDTAFDFGKHATKYRKIDINIQSITSEVPKGVVNAILTISYHGKYFTTRYLEVFAYRYDGKVGKLLRQTRTRLVASHPKLLDGRIFIVDQVSKNDLKEAFASPSVDEKLEEILKGDYKIFPQRQEVSILFLFREAPSIGSIVRTHVGPYTFEHKVKNNAPYFIIENNHYIGINYKYKMPYLVFVDGVLVGRRVTSM